MSISFIDAILPIDMDFIAAVGVTGSGKGMTEVKLPGKHKFDQTLDRE